MSHLARRFGSPSLHMNFAERDESLPMRVRSVARRWKRGSSPTDRIPRAAGNPIARWHEIVRRILQAWAGWRLPGGLTRRITVFRPPVHRIPEAENHLVMPRQEKAWRATASPTAWWRRSARTFPTRCSGQKSRSFAKRPFVSTGGTAADSLHTFQGLGRRRQRRGEVRPPERTPRASPTPFPRPPATTRRRPRRRSRPHAPGTTGPCEFDSRGQSRCRPLRRAEPESAEPPTRRR